MDQESKQGTSAVAGPRCGLFTGLWVGGWLIARVQSLAQLIVFCFQVVILVQLNVVPRVPSDFH